MTKQTRTKQANNDTNKPEQTTNDKTNTNKTKQVQQ